MESIVTKAEPAWGVAKVNCFNPENGKNKNLPLVLQVPCCPAIAGNGEVGGLGVQGEQLQVHWAVIYFYFIYREVFQMVVKPLLTITNYLTKYTNQNAF